MELTALPKRKKGMQLSALQVVTMAIVAVLLNNTLK